MLVFVAGSSSAKELSNDLVENAFLHQAVAGHRHSLCQELGLIPCGCLDSLFSVVALYLVTTIFSTSQRFC